MGGRILKMGGMRGDNGGYTEWDDSWKVFLHIQDLGLSVFEYTRTYMCICERKTEEGRKEIIGGHCRGIRRIDTQGIVIHTYMYKMKML